MTALPESRPAPSRRHVRPWWHVVERLSLYMPVVLMALLALGSYWLLRATPPTPSPEPERMVDHQPTDVMRGFAVRTYGPDGHLRSEVLGQEARRFADDSSMEMDQARIRSFSDTGVLTTAEGDRVWTDANHRQYVLTGNAVVVRHAGPAAKPTRLLKQPDSLQLPHPAAPLERLEFRGDHLQVFTDERRVVSEQPVLLIRGNHRITAQRLDWADTERVALLTGRVRALLATRAHPH